MMNLLKRLIQKNNAGNLVEKASCNTKIDEI